MKGVLQRVGCQVDMNQELLERFEAGLNPQDLKGSAIPATVLGFGEISTVFQIGEDLSAAYKRMPLFSDRDSAKEYAQNHGEYCQMLRSAGLRLPEMSTAVIELPDRPVVLYIEQTQFPVERFAHQLIRSLDASDVHRIIGPIVSEIAKVWRFNRSNRPSLELAIDGQLSNWVCLQNPEGLQITYVDTSTPLYRKNEVEQLDPELFLKSAPSFLRWVIRLFFLEQVMERYYDPRQVYTDLAANLCKEQRPDLIPHTIQEINASLPKDIEPLTTAQVEGYYKQDKLIWSLFLSFRKVDRWLKTRVFGKRYEFILPGSIKR
jgi:hypothetical protein